MNCPRIHRPTVYVQAGHGDHTLKSTSLFSIITLCVVNNVSIYYSSTIRSFLELR